VQSRTNRFQKVVRASLALPLAAVAVIGTAGAAHAASPTIDLYEGNNGTQNLVCSIPATPRAVNFQNDGFGCDNDEARSLVLHDVPAGRVIRVYDSPGGSTEDDWTTITVKRSITRRVIGTFQQDVNDSQVQVVYHRNNGLDGKVSRLVVS
jgi:hypothetical protein